MEAITIIYTRNPQEAVTWDLDLKFVSSQGDIFYTARIFFHPHEKKETSKYFQTLFTSEFKENKNNTLQLNFSTKTMEKYFQILSGKGCGLVFTDQELVELIEIGDQQDLKVIVDYINDPIVSREMISAEDFYRLVNYYDLEVNLDVNNLIHLEGIADHLDQLEEPVLWDCFDLVCSNLHNCKIYKKEPKIDLKEYKRIALACYDRFPDKAEVFRDHAKKYLDTFTAIPVDQREDLNNKLREAGLFRKESIVSFRVQLEACLDVILNFSTEPEFTGLF